MNATSRTVDALLRCLHDGDRAGALSRLTEDVVVDIVGFADGLLVGRSAVAHRLDWFLERLVHEGDVPVRRWASPCAVVDETRWRGRMIGRGAVELDVLAVYQFCDEQIARVIAWPQLASSGRDLRGGRRAG